ncbi:MAG: hypothetical protein KDB14_08885, partial [Planctomycetales bacterium]|nr:hypothetical protein [Planctomycetales bacterium]
GRSRRSREGKPNQELDLMSISKEQAVKHLDNAIAEVRKVFRYVNESYPWKVGDRADWSLTSLGEYLHAEPQHANSIDWESTANITEHLLSMLESLHPDSAVMLGPFRDHIEETAS